MISIKKRIIIKRFFTIMPLIISVIIAIFVICILPTGIHNKNIANLAIAENVDVYISTKHANIDISKAINSIYENEALDTKLLTEFNAMLKISSSFLQTILLNTTTSNEIINNILLSYFYNRNAAFMIWGRGANDSLANSRKYLLFDIGIAASLIFDKLIYRDKLINISQLYSMTKTSYYGASVYSISQRNTTNTQNHENNNNNNEIYFIIYKGKLIFTNKLESVKKIIELLSADLSRIKNIAHIDEIQTKMIFAPNLSFYMSNWGYNKIFNLDVEMLKGYKFSSMQGHINFNDSKININMYLINNHNTKLSYNDNNTNLQIISEYADERCPIYLGITQESSNFYTNIRNSENLANVNNTQNMLNNFLSKYDIKQIVRANNQTAAIFYIIGKEGEISPIFAINIPQHEMIMPQLERYLITKYSNKQKSLDRYAGKTTYTYRYGNKSLYFTSIKNTLFFTESKETLERFMDSTVDNSIAKAFKKNKIDIYNKNYIFISSDKNAINTLLWNNSSNVFYTYNRQIFAATHTGKNITTIEMRFLK